MVSIRLEMKWSMIGETELMFIKDPADVRNLYSNSIDLVVDKFMGKANRHRP